MSRLAQAFASPQRAKRSRNDEGGVRSVQSPFRAAKGLLGQGKVCYFNDPVHGNIAMSGLCLEIIDTKEFQRLRDLKQLGTCDFVFPGATHSRFSHSIGVAHYAERVMRTLMKNQPDLLISEQDLLCVKVAGLCHDLGHGPFSHVFDGVFMARMHPGKKMHHEDWSVAILRHLLKDNNINVTAYGLREIDLTFITEIIAGTPEASRVGRPSEKFYLYDIVNNSRSGLDVDKLDYFQRDIKHTNVDANCNQFQRFLEFGRVMAAEPVETAPSVAPASFKPFLDPDSPIIAVPGERVTAAGTAAGHRAYMVCYPEKMVGEALQLFTLRYQLHQKVYTHKSIKKVEYMLVDALEMADPFITIPGSKTATHPNGLYRMSECAQDPAAMCNLTDSVVYVIETSTSPELAGARKLLERIRKRDFVRNPPSAHLLAASIHRLIIMGQYSCLGKTVYQRRSRIDQCSTDEIRQALVDIANASIAKQRAQALDAAGQSPGMGADLQPSDEVEYDGGFEFIQSQDSFAPWLRKVTSSQTDDDGLVTPEDLIVEKMHIHYGMKGENPVNRLRFYSKDVLPTDVARKVKEESYETLLPRVFEELAVRVFSRNSRKDLVLLRAFQDWCRDFQASSPFPSLSQA